MMRPQSDSQKRASAQTLWPTSPWRSPEHEGSCAFMARHDWDSCWAAGAERFVPTRVCSTPWFGHDDRESRGRSDWGRVVMLWWIGYGLSLSFLADAKGRWVRVSQCMARASIWEIKSLYRLEAFSKPLGPYDFHGKASKNRLYRRFFSLIKTSGWTWYWYANCASLSMADGYILLPFGWRQWCRKMPSGSKDVLRNKLLTKCHTKVPKEVPTKVSTQVVRFQLFCFMWATAFLCEKGKTETRHSFLKHLKNEIDAFKMW